MEENKQLQKLRKLSILMDSKFTGPWGFKFGLDGILGLIPFAGDFIGTAISFYIIVQAVMLGCSPSTILRMGLNILIENLADMFPVLGNIFDFFWRSNNKNMELLEQHMLNPRKATFKSRLTLGLVAFFLLAILISSVALTIFVFKSILEWISVFSS